MKKKISLILIGLLLLGVSVFAAGDLIVNGKLGAGTASPTNRLHVTDTNSPPLNVIGTRSSNVPFDGAALITTNDSAISPTYGSAGMKINMEHTGSGTGAGTYYAGANYLVTLSGSSTSNAGIISQFNLIKINNPSGAGYLLDSATGSLIRFMDTSGSSATNTVAELTGLYLDKIASIGSSNYTVSNANQILIRDLAGDMGAGAKTRWSVGNSTGIWVDKQTLGDTKNYGLVLNGDGAGSDIVFGNSGGNRPRIYSTAGVIYADDAFGSHTQISPHDPETGEWIYYSKNTKTGVVKRVNMEKLVRAVEKLTGETFMVETLSEE